MLGKKIKYTDYNGVEREEKFYFNLSKAELLEMQLTKQGGMETYLRRIVNEQDQVKIAEIFKMFITKSYGKKSDDGKRFIKSQELTDEFLQSEAYSELYSELIMDANAASAFINGIIPPALAQAAEAELKKNGGKLPDLDEGDTNA